MQRTDHLTRKLDLFGLGKHGFGGGIPGVEPATVLDSPVMNAIQEELANVVEVYGGATLDPAKYDQVTTALQRGAGQVQGAREVSAAHNTTLVEDVLTSDVWALAAGPDGLLTAVGADGKTSWSTDGKTWIPVAAAGGYTNVFTDVIWSHVAGYFIAIGFGGAIQTSPNNSGWTSRTNSMTGYGRRIAESASRIMIGPSAGSFAISSDGVSWGATATSPNAGDFEVTSLLYTGSRWVVSGVDDGGAPDDTKAIYWSADDGATWTAATTAAALASGDYVVRVEQHGTSLVALCANVSGSSWRLIRSTDDGLTWANVMQVASTAGQTWDLVAGQHCLMAANTSANPSRRTMRFSYDGGATWHWGVSPGFAGCGRIFQLHFEALSDPSAPGTRC
jgi:hypothetical protein